MNELVRGTTPGGPMITTDAQVRKLMNEISKGQRLEVSAQRAGMDRKTASKYVRLGKLPSELKEVRTWRTRPDPFEAVWGAAEAMLREAPELEAKTVFEVLLTGEPGHEPGQLRSFQRRVREWRAQSGPPKEVFFAQVHRAGEAMQTDFTHGTELSVTLAGVAFPHLLCHCVLPYSNWEWATVCASESLAAIQRGVQAALFRLGRRPTYHQTDNSTGATHHVSGGGRGFNVEYEAFMTHVGMTPRTIGIGQSEQNGDVESLNGALKRRLKQHLLVRGSRDFESLATYEKWVGCVVDQANGLRGQRFQDELAAMEPVSAARLPEFRTEDVVVSSWSTIRVQHNAYSVPARLIGETVRVRLHTDRVEVFFAGRHELTLPRLAGRNGHRINYRHIIWSLVKKPGAFERYRYREELFPSAVFRQAFDAFQKAHPGTRGDLEYLRVLHLAASTLETDVEVALERAMMAGELRDAETVKRLVTPVKAVIPRLTVPAIDLTAYDALLTFREVA